MPFPPPPLSSSVLSSSPPSYASRYTPAGYTPSSPSRRETVVSKTRNYPSQAMKRLRTKHETNARV